MADTLLLGTRKGLVVYRRKAKRWKLDGVHFTGFPVTLAERDEQGSWWALPDHGHWTCLHSNLPMIHLVRFV